jgi:hypothetical protein
MAWLRSVLRDRAIWLAWVAQGAALGAAVTAMFVLWWAFPDFDLRTQESAYGSIVFALIGFEWLVLLIFSVMLTFALAWSLLAPGDPRGHAVSLNAALVGFFAAGAWFVIAATLYIAPRLAGPG